MYFLEGDSSCGSYFGARGSGSSSGSEELLPPFTADRLKPTDHVAADSAGFSVAEPPVPVPAFDPPRSFLAALFFAAELRHQFPCGSEPSRGGGGQLSGFVQRIAQAPEGEGDVGRLRDETLEGDERVEG